MFIWIPGELISILTFPGVIVHEIAHRFFCDIFNVPVYEIHYFRPFSKTAGHVRHHPTNNFWVSFFIGIAPLLVNSVLCIVLTFPLATSLFLGTEFLGSTYPIFGIFNFLGYLIGLTIGFNAMPSRQDLARLREMADSRTTKALSIIANVFIWPFNEDGFGPILSLGYAVVLSFALPWILFH